MQKSINTENIPNESLWNLTLLGPTGQIRPIICLSQWTKNAFYVFFNSVQFSSVAQSCLTLCNPMDCSMPGFLSNTNSHSLLKLMPIELVMPSNHLIFCHPLFLLPSVFPSIRVFSNELALCIRWLSIGASASTSMNIPMNIQSWFPLDLTGWISLQSKGLSGVFSNTTGEHQCFGAQLSL